VVAGVIARAVDSDGSLVWLALTVMVGALCLGFWSARQQRVHAPTPQVGLEVAQYKGAVQPPGAQQGASVLITPDRDALVLLGRGRTKDHLVLPYSDIASAHHVHLNALLGPMRERIAVVRRDGDVTWLAMRSRDADTLLTLLAARGAARQPMIEFNSFKYGFGKVPPITGEPPTDRVASDASPIVGVEAEVTLPRPAPPPRPPRHRKRIAIWATSITLAFVVAFVAFAIWADATNPNRPASDEDVATAAAQAQRVLTGWSVPPEVVRSSMPDHVNKYGHGGIRIIRHFEPASGVTAGDALTALVQVLNAQGYALRDELDGSWDGFHCRLPSFPHCILAVELAGPDRLRIDVTFLP